MLCKNKSLETRSNFFEYDLWCEQFSLVNAYCVGVFCCYRKKLNNILDNWCFSS